MQPNVLLVVLDAARRDALEPYGAPPGSTPAIAQLARRGSALQDVYATSCWTVPSHASLLTGLLPRAAGLSRARSPAAVAPRLEEHRERLLPEVLRRAGYATAGASANLWLSRASGFDALFEEFTEVDTDRNAQIHAHGLRERLRWLAEAGLGRVDDGAGAIERVLDGWLTQPSRRPFFWFVNLVECHSPYLPPRPYGDVSLVDRLRAAEDARRHYTLLGIWRACCGLESVPAPALARLRRLYRASIRYMDDWLGRVLERLDRARVLEDTLVVVTSDHGENFGENGLIAHAMSLDERLINVPLVVAGPGSGSPPISSLAHLPSMIADAAGLEAHPWTGGPPAGFGLAQFDPPFDPADPEAGPALEKAGLEAAREAFTTPLTCAVASGLKLLRRGTREEVYDLRADPLEREPLSPEAAIAAGRGATVEELRRALDHPSVAGGSAVAPGPAPPEHVSQAEIDDLEKRMKLLGYL
jgi:arylsulfatase A-like enzyme